jgi:hypothetical protein
VLGQKESPGRRQHIGAVILHDFAFCDKRRGSGNRVNANQAVRLDDATASDAEGCGVKGKTGKDVVCDDAVFEHNVGAGGTVHARCIVPHTYAGKQDAAATNAADT